VLRTVPPLSSEARDARAQANDVAAFGALLAELVKHTRGPPAPPGAPRAAPNYALTRHASAPPRRTRARGPPPALLVLARSCCSAEPADHPTMEQAREICARVWQSVAPVA
jgi:hypothetical protein